MPSIDIHRRSGAQGASAWMAALRSGARRAAAGASLLCALVLSACSGGGDEPMASAAALSIREQPRDAMVKVGETATFNVLATGDGLRYQWRRDGRPLSAATHPTLEVLVQSEADHGAQYSVVVSNPTQSLVSAEAKVLVVRHAVVPEITVPPASQGAVAGQEVVFSVTATGSEPLGYRWQRDGVDIGGADAASYRATVAAGDDGARFRVIVANAVGSATSAEAVLRVAPAPTAPSVVSPPSDTTVQAPAAARFSVAAVGSEPLAYQWQRDGVDIAGATGPSLATAPTAASDDGARYSVVVSNAAGSVRSAGALLRVLPAGVAPAIASGPVATAVAEGQTATFTVTATGTAPLTYQWRRDGQTIVGANAASYTTPALRADLDDGARYDVKVLNAVGSATSAAAVLGVTPPPPPAPSSHAARLLAATPEGGWVRASTNAFSEAWPTGADAVPPTPSSPNAVLTAWSGFAWDTRRSSLLIFGGGHANYAGNEVYIWRASDGRWARGSLPSKVDLTTSFVVGNDAPQSAHTYQTTTYAPLVDRLVVFGGASWGTYGVQVDDQGRRTGPWWWDPSRADPDRVGGGSGTGWDPARPGSDAWQMRPHGPNVGLPALANLQPNFSQSSAAWTTEGGQDVIYVTMDSHGSGWPSLYRYALGRPEGTDTFEMVGMASGRSRMSQGAAAIDSRNGLFVRTAIAQLAGPYPAPGDLGVWRLSARNPLDPGANRDTPVELVDASGAAIDTSYYSSIAYDEANDQFVLWDGQDRGTVHVTRTTFLPDGRIAPTWVAHRLPSTTAEQPNGGHPNGVLGKWRYAPELRAFVALDRSLGVTEPGAVWLYKPPSGIRSSAGAPARTARPAMR